MSTSSGSLRDRQRDRDVRALRLRKLTPKKGSAGPRTGDWRVVFLATLGLTANVAGACRAAGVSRQAAYAARARHADFRERWDGDLQDALDMLEAVAWERARTSSDTLLIFLLKAHRRELYG